MYLEAFGKDRILVLVFEELIKNPTSRLNAVYDFLGVSRVDQVDAIRSNPTEVVRFPALIRLNMAAARVIGVAVHDMLPSSVYSRLAGLNHGFARVLRGAMASDKSVRMPADERAWVASHYRDEVARLRDMTGLAFTSWSGDFPAGGA